LAVPTVARVLPAGGTIPVGADHSRREYRMPLYETVLIARNDVTQQQVEAIADEITTELEAGGGSVRKREYWGLRSLAYRIKKNRKGHYMLLGLDAAPAFITEMERKLGLNEDVLRYMSIRVEEIEEPMMREIRILDLHEQPLTGFDLLDLSIILTERRADLFESVDRS